MDKFTPPPPEVGSFSREVLLLNTGMKHGAVDDLYPASLENSVKGFKASLTRQTAVHGVGDASNYLGCPLMHRVVETLHTKITLGHTPSGRVRTQTIRQVYRTPTRTAVYLAFGVALFNVYVRGSKFVNNLAIIATHANMFKYWLTVIPDEHTVNLIGTAQQGG